MVPSKQPPDKSGDIAGSKLHLSDLVGYFHPPALLLDEIKIVKREFVKIILQISIYFI
jgi:hypothetical protein